MKRNERNEYAKKYFLQHLIESKQGKEKLDKIYKKMQEKGLVKCQKLT